jgi:hypothetical protein
MQKNPLGQAQIPALLGHGSKIPPLPSLDPVLCLQRFLATYLTQNDPSKLFGVVTGGWVTVSLDRPGLLS